LRKQGQVRKGGGEGKERGGGKGMEERNDMGQGRGKGK